MADPSSPLILLPVDGSDSSVRAARHCAVLAAALGASVIVLNVQPEIEDWQTHGVGRKSAEEHLMARAKEATALATKALADAGIVLETLVKHGEVADVIASVVAQRNCSSVVMGTRGEGELKGLVMGSVGMKLIHLVQVPVTFVH